ncbi:Glycosyl hydrolase family 92 [compost metagenome]
MLNLEGGKRFTVRTVGLSDDKPYLGAVTLNGKPLTRSFLRDAEIRAGGELVFTMNATPNKTWASAAKDRPMSMTAYGK